MFGATLIRDTYRSCESVIYILHDVHAYILQTLVYIVNSSLHGGRKITVST